MEIVISNSSGQPIYEQIVTQIKSSVMQGGLRDGERLPSIRSLANDLGVSVITTKRAYADLEDQGFIKTVQGKGCFVSCANAELLREEQLRRVESGLAEALAGAREAGLTLEEVHGLVDTLWEE